MAASGTRQATSVTPLRTSGERGQAAERSLVASDDERLEQRVVEALGQARHRVLVHADGRAPVVGGFNHFLVAASKLAPGVVDHYVARTGVASQQSDQDADAHAPHDLWAPVDDGSDAGDRGPYVDEEGGVLGSGWLLSVPKLAVEVGASAAARLADVVAARVRR